MLISLDGRGPLYQQIYRGLRAAVLNGTLTAGERLPATRGLAEQLAVSRNVVLAAYQHLVDEGYAEARVGAGTYICSDLPDRLLGIAPEAPRSGATAPSPVRLSAFGRRLKSMGPFADHDERQGPAPAYDFRYGLALPDPSMLTVWRRLLTRHSRRLPMEYANPQGSAPLRRQIAVYLGRSRGLTVAPSRVVITSGSQQALDLLIRLSAEPGDTIAIEDPGYRGARQVFKAAGLSLHACGVDQQGLIPDLLSTAEQPPRWVYVTPSHQFPTGAVMPLERRLFLLEWAGRHGAFIIEDDYDSELRYEGPPLEAMAALDRHQRVLYVGTFSKVLFPALRLGYVVLPEPMVDVFNRAKHLTDRHSPSLEQAVLADFFAEGHFDRHLRRMRRRNSTRLQALRRALGEFFGDDAIAAESAAGIHLMVTFPGRTGEEITQWVRAAADVGVGLYALAPYYSTAPAVPGLLFGYANLNEAEIHEGLRRLAQVTGYSSR